MSADESRRVLIVDDHPLFRDALELALMKASDGRCTPEHCATLEAALDALRAGPCALVLLDLNLADSTGFDGLIRLQALESTVPVAVVSATESPAAYRRAHGFGALGYLPKSAGLETLTSALQALLAGEAWFPEGLDADECESDDAGDTARRISSLTPAQRRVLDGLSEGLLNKQIAYDMGISEATVKAHMTAIFRKLGVNNRTQALLMLKSAAAIGDHSAA